MNTKNYRIITLQEQRRSLQQRARSIRATTGTPYSSEVHLLLGQSYLDPASWQEPRPTPPGSAQRHVGHSSRAGTGPSWHV